jgi:hypothetical protein
MQQSKNTANRAAVELAPRHIPEGPRAPASNPTFFDILQGGIKTVAELEERLLQIHLRLFGEPGPRPELPHGETLETMAMELSSRLACATGLAATISERL